MFGGSGLHPGIVEQAVDQHLAARQFEAWQLDRQLAADLAHHQLDATAEEPAHARHQQHHQHGPGGQGGENHEGPQRYRYGLVHGDSAGADGAIISELSDDIRNICRDKVCV
jgi:hypothetical protein